MKPTDLARKVLKGGSTNSGEVVVLARAVLELEAENARLRAALEKYGQHLPSCATTLNTYRRNGPPKKCDCGWSALTPPKEPKP